MALHTHGTVLRTAGIKVLRTLNKKRTVLPVVRTGAQLEKLKKKLKKK